MDAPLPGFPVSFPGAPGCYVRIRPTPGALAPQQATHGSDYPVHRDESARVLATLIRLLGDFDLAEEAFHDAFSAALQQWPNDGVPDNPRAWLVSTGRFKAIDALRRGHERGYPGRRADTGGEIIAMTTW